MHRLYNCIMEYARILLYYYTVCTRSRMLRIDIPKWFLRRNGIRQACTSQDGTSQDTSPWKYRYITRHFTVEVPPADDGSETLLQRHDKWMQQRVKKLYQTYHAQLVWRMTHWRIVARLLLTWARDMDGRYLHLMPWKEDTDQMTPTCSDSLLAT